MPFTVMSEQTHQTGEMGMKRIWSGLAGRTPSGPAASREKTSVAEFEALAVPLLDPAFNLARWLTRDDHEAEDLVQETYLKAYRNFNTFQSGTNFRAWIYRILRNTFLTSRTGLKAASSVPLDSEEYGPDLAIESKTPETILVAHLDSRMLQHAIEQLPVHYREALLLCDVEEMSYRQIAEILSIPIGTVMSRLARARKLVRESLCTTPRKPPSGSAFHQTRTPEVGSPSKYWTVPESMASSHNGCAKN
jgi:RNA polymerase sigma-70 factor (ECF subfamily)